MNTRLMMIAGLAGATLGCSPATSPTSRPVPSTTEPSHRADIRVRTPGTDIDVDANRNPTGTGRKIDVNVDTNKR